MTESEDFSPDWITKPGDSVRSAMRRRGVNPDALAMSLPGGPAELSGILSGTVPIDENLARALSRALGGTGEFWLARQRKYDEALGRAVGKAAKTESDAWLLGVNVPGAKPRGQLTERKKEEEIRRRLAFFNVSDIRAWNARYGSTNEKTRFRISHAYTAEEAAVSMWLRQGEIKAEMVSTATWNPGALRNQIDDIRRLTQISRPLRFLPRLKGLLAEAGVALVVVKAPRGCPASGASRLVSSDRGMILVSFRYRADDQFWFTVFHEMAHLILHEGRTFVDDIETPDDDVSEVQADDFASACVVPDNRRPEFEQIGLDRDSVLRFSVSIGVSPGLIVGQLQHRGLLGYHQMNSLKRRWTWAELDAALSNL